MALWTSPRKSEAGTVGFSLEEYAKLRPTLWHFTHKANLPLIRRNPTLLCAARFLHGNLLDEPRRGRSVRDGVPVLRDQDLLHEGSICFQSGSSMIDVVRDLNARVFFWSGWPDRPVRSGRHAFARYCASDIIFRVPFQDVAEQSPHFSRCNSGAIRKQGGKAVPRGPATFAEAEESRFDPTAVVEVTFLGCVLLPKTTDVGESLKGPWKPLR